jgi:hypothetical protein
MEGEKMKDTDRAFPVLDSYVGDGGQWRLDCLDSGMTLRQYAAIKLKVPRSGDPEIDAMIRESRRADFAAAALTGALRECHSPDSASKYAYAVADAMLAEWEKEKNNV